MQLRLGLVHYPTTLAPISGSRIVAAQCADNAHIRPGSSLNVMCVFNGTWFGLLPQCECDDEYHPKMVHNRLICKGYIVICMLLYYTSEKIISLK